MDPKTITEHEFTFSSGKTRYLSAGPTNGPLLIFIHGWIAVSETWKPQLLSFASLGFHVVAPDTRGYGGSTVTRNITDYRLEQHVTDMLALIEHLGREEAVWIGHDWGCGLVWALVAHHPEVCAAVACMTVPYRTIEFGLDRLVSLVNREIYPVEEYPLGQWDYQAYHAEQQERSEKTLDADPENTIKCLYTPGSPDRYGKPARTANMRAAGGWWGKEDAAFNIGVESTLLKDEPEILEKLADTLRKNGSFGPNAYYLNHDVNTAYSMKSVNGGVLEMPVLFIGARFDATCDTSVSSLSEPMRRYCRDLTECTIDSGHWVAHEKHQETNAAIVRWLVTRLPTYWPGYWNVPFGSTPKSGIKE